MEFINPLYITIACLLLSVYHLIVILLERVSWAVIEKLTKDTQKQTEYEDIFMWIIAPHIMVLRSWR